MHLLYKKMYLRLLTTSTICVIINKLDVFSRGKIITVTWLKIRITYEFHSNYERFADNDHYIIE